MECPHCSLEFQPILSSHYLGLNGKKQFCHLVWQLCPRCQEFVICLMDNSVKEDIFKCSNCQGINIVFDPQTGEKLCENCGAVLAEKLESSESQLKTKPEDQKPGAHAGISDEC